MNRTQKILTGIGALILIAGALIIRQNEAGYLLFLEGDFKSAEIAFQEDAKRGDPWGAYFAGMLNDRRGFGINDKTKAAKAYLQSARLGSVDGAIRYINLIKFSQHKGISCSLILKIIDTAVQTHHFLAVTQKAQRLQNGNCSDKNNFESLHYTQWAGELVPAFGSNFHDRYQKMNAPERQKFDAIKFQKPPRINDQEFLKFFSAQLGLN